MSATLEEWNDFRKVAVATGLRSILQFNIFRMKKNMSDFMKYKEKEECYDAVQTVAMKVNHHDPDMMSHVIMSIFKVANAEANVPPPPPTPAPSQGLHRSPSTVLCIVIIIFT